MWKYPDDNSRAILTPQQNIESIHGSRQQLRLPKTAVVFFMSRGVEYLRETHDCRLLTEKLPRFLQSGPAYSLNEVICFLDGGRGAPQAADTVETLSTLGVENVVAVGMCGAFSEGLRAGDILVPPLAFSEEGTSRHYYEHPDSFAPHREAYTRLCRIPNCKTLPIVSTDGVYRQTFYKEALWREKGAVAVDMETSAVLGVAQYLGISAAAVLMVSDCHPLYDGAPAWKWHMTAEMRQELFKKTIEAILGA